MSDKKLKLGPGSGLPWMSTKHGMWFMGYEPATQDDIDALMNYLNQNPKGRDRAVKIVESSKLGRLDRDWGKGFSSAKKYGGLGSHTYEVQKVNGGPGVNDVAFRKDDAKAIWHIGPDGKRCHGVLDYDKTGTAFHKDEWGQTVTGPEPGSAAEEKLGDGEYRWNKKNQWWVIKRG